MRRLLLLLLLLHGLRWLQCRQFALGCNVGARQRMLQGRHTGAP
jgi:hypothetical protein